MNYYIAKDRFGNYDLAHYGVKGMKWGETNADPYSIASRAGSMRSAITNQTSQKSSSQSPSSSGSGSKGVWASGRGGGSSAPEKAQASAPTVNKELVKAINETASEAPKDEDDAKIAEANVNYQSALMNMQLLARIALGNGISPAANLEYLEARKKAIEAKYELDKLNLAKQEKAAKNPPTMAEQRRIDDSNAKKELAEDKSKSRKSGIPEVDVEYTRQDKVGKRAADTNRGANRAKPTGKKSK